MFERAHFFAPLQDLAVAATQIISYIGFTLWFSVLTYHSHNPAPFRIHEIRYMENFHLTLWPMHFGTDLCTHYESFAIHLTDKTDWTR